MTLSPYSFAGRFLSPRFPPPRFGAHGLFGLALSLAFLTVLSGCGRLRERAKPETIYVVVEQTYLRDRVAPVSARVALVTNGEPLQVVEHNRRFFKVKTGKGEVGWIEEHMVIDQATFDQFVRLKEVHQHDPVVATGVLRNLLYLHLKPGRKTERFYLLPENDKLQLLARASVSKGNQGLLPLSKSSRAGLSGKAEPAQAGTRSAPAAMGGIKEPPPPAPEPPIPMEDWWLVRDKQGQVGWLLARQLDVDVPDEIAGYSEGQKMVGAYVLAKVYDPESNFPDKQAPIYVAVLNAYKDGLPYDFDQVRVFTWSVKRHRYETAFRLRNIEGYLPVEVAQESASGGARVPVFSVRVATSEAVTTDPLTGAARPTQTETLRFELQGQVVKKVAPAGEQEAVEPVHPHAIQPHPGRRLRPKRAGGG